MSSQLWRRVVIEDVQFLLENGADPTAVTENEDTALHIAAYRDDVRIIEVDHRYRPSFSDPSGCLCSKLLLNYGADMDQLDAEKEPALFVAIHAVAKAALKVSQ